MDWIISNSWIIIAAICCACMVIFAIITFIKQPNDKKIEAIKQWLLWAVVEAEKQFGSGTGQLKLRYVYNLAVQQFSWIPSLVSFDTFAEWVDESLIWMQKQLESNKAIQTYIEG